MKINKSVLFVLGSLGLLSGLLNAQAPLAEPLADFDKLVSNLRIGAVVGEPIKVGETLRCPVRQDPLRLGRGRRHDGLRRGHGR